MYIIKESLLLEMCQGGFKCLQAQFQTAMGPRYAKFQACS
jgi:hypothetical protein